MGREMLPQTGDPIKVKFIGEDPHLQTVWYSPLGEQDNILYIESQHQIKSWEIIIIEEAQTQTPSLDQVDDEFSNLPNVDHRGVLRYTKNGWLITEIPG